MDPLLGEEPPSPCILVTNIEGVAKAVHKRLCREAVTTPTGPPAQTEEEVTLLFQAVVQGCCEALARQKKVTNPIQSQEGPSLHEAPRAVINKGRNLGELAAGALIKRAEQEQETDALMHRWELALEEQSRKNELLSSTRRISYPRFLRVSSSKNSKAPRTLRSRPRWMMRMT